MPELVSCWLISTSKRSRGMGAGSKPTARRTFPLVLVDFTVRGPKILPAPTKGAVAKTWASCRAVEPGKRKVWASSLIRSSLLRRRRRSLVARSPALSIFNRLRV